jgi:hypothetical protein
MKEMGDNAPKIRGMPHKSVNSFSTSLDGFLSHGQMMTSEENAFLASVCLIALFMEEEE